MSKNEWIQDAITEYFCEDTVAEFDDDEIISIIRNLQRMEEEQRVKCRIGHVSGR